MLIDKCISYLKVKKGLEMLSTSYNFTYLNNHHLQNEFQIWKLKSLDPNYPEVTYGILNQRSQSGNFIKKFTKDQVL